MRVLHLTNDQFDVLDEYTSEWDVNSIEEINN